MSSTITSGEASGHEVVISRNRPTCCCILFDVTWLLVGKRVLPFSSFSACISSMLFCQPYVNALQFPSVDVDEDCSQILVRQCQNWITSTSSFLLLDSRSKCWALSTELLSGSALALHKRHVPEVAFAGRTYTPRPLIHHCMGNDDQRRFARHCISDLIKSLSPCGQPGLSEKAHRLPNCEPTSHVSP